MSNKTARRLSWIVWNSTMVILAILGVAFQVEMAANVFKFATWLVAPIMILGFCSDKGQAKIRKKGPSVSPYLTLCVDLALALMLAAYAWFGYATLIAVSGICGASIYLADDDDTRAAVADKGDGAED